MYRKALALTWLLAFAFAEALGVTFVYLAYMMGVDELFYVAISDLVIVLARFSFLIYISKQVSGVDLKYAVFEPLIGVKKTILLGIFILTIAVLDFSISTVIYNSYTPQLMEISYYLNKGILWLFPLKVLYYFSEITVMNYMYLLARETWPQFKPPITAGTLFLIITWALPHIVTKNFLVAIYSIILVIVFYMGFEYTDSPITPVLLWFTAIII